MHKAQVSVFLLNSEERGTISRTGLLVPSRCKVCFENFADLRFDRFGDGDRRLNPWCMFDDGDDVVRKEFSAKGAPLVVGEGERRLPVLENEDQKVEFL